MLSQGIKSILQIAPQYRAEMRLNVFILVAMITILIAAYISPLPSWANGLSSYLPLHTLLETISIVISMLVFAVGWTNHSNNPSNHITLLSCLFLGVGLLDFSHMFSFAGMPDYVTPSNPEKAINFWLAARVLAASSLLILALEPLSFTFGSKNKYLMLCQVLALTGVAHWLFLLHPDFMPSTFVPDSGLTALKIASEYALIAINLLTASLFYQRAKRFQAINPAALFAAVSTMALSELCFTLYANVTDIFNLLGHVFKLVSYIYLYRAIFVETIENPYRLLKLSEADLLQKTALLNAILDDTSDAIYAKNVDGSYILFNTAAANFVGKQSAEVIGKDDTFLFPEDQAKAVMMRDRLVMDGGSTRTYEDVVTTANNQLSTFLATKGPLFDQQGAVVGLFGISRDISDSKAMLLKLQESEQRFKMMADSAPVLIWLAGTDKLCYWFNATWLNFTGRSLEQENGNGWADGVHPDDFQRCLDIYMSYFDRREAFSMEYRLKRHDGEYRWILDNGAPRFDDSGVFLGYIGSCTDISDQKTALEKLQESEQRLIFIQSAAQIGTWDWDLSQEQAICNPQFYQLFGLAEGSPLTYAEFLDMVHPEDRFRLDALIQHNVSNHIPDYYFEYRLLRGDGQFRWFTSKGQFVFKDDTAERLVGVVMDITERKAAESELQKLAQAVEQSPESIIITNLKGEIEYVNSAFSKNSGYRAEEVLGRNPRLLKSGLTPVANYTALWQAITNGQAWKGEFYNRRKDGSDYIDFAIITPLRQLNGQVTHYVSVQEDITEKKKITDELSQYRYQLEDLVATRTIELENAKQLAELANQAKSAFLANMSHEIRTPMNTIVGLSYILRNSADNPKLIEGLNKIDGAANHLLSIINDILDLSKIEAGELHLEHIDFSLEKLFDSLIFLISEQAKAKNLSIETDFDHVPMWLNGDPMRLKQALLNFVSNAIKFTEKGFIKLSVKVLDASETELLLKFTVQDSGIGIPEEKLNTLFEAFTQADVSTTRKYGGTGLGLTITRSLAKLMQGEIGVESSTDQGSTFWFTALLQQAHGKMSGEAIDKQTHAEIKFPEFKAGITILLVEDNPINLEVAKEILENVGFLVDTAENGRVAVEMVAKNAYQLVLMDMQMPEMDGIEATKVIRQLVGEQALPIIAMTANAFEEDKLACINAGMNDFVSKPVVPANLYSTLKRWLPLS